MTFSGQFPLSPKRLQVFPHLPLGCSTTYRDLEKVGLPLSFGPLAPHRHCGTKDCCLGGPAVDMGKRRCGEGYIESGVLVSHLSPLKGRTGCIPQAKRKEATTQSSCPGVSHSLRAHRGMLNMQHKEELVEPRECSPFLETAA